MGVAMAEVVPTPEDPTRRKVRFARVVAGVAFVFALIGLGYGHLSLVSAAAVCAAIALASAAISRDVYAVVGGLVAGAIALTSPAMTQTLSSMRAEQIAAREAENTRIAEGIAEVEAYDAHIRGYQPNLDDLKRNTASYSRLAGLMAQQRNRLLVSRSVNSPDQQSILNVIIAMSSRIETLHSEAVAAKETFDRNVAAIPGKWSHIQSLCKSPEIGSADACSRVREDYPSYRARVAQVEEALRRDEDAYGKEKPRLQAIIADIL